MAVIFKAQLCICTILFIIGDKSFFRSKSSSSRSLSSSQMIHGSMVPDRTIVSCPPSRLIKPCTCSVKENFPYGQACFELKCELPTTWTVIKQVLNVFRAQGSAYIGLLSIANVADTRNKVLNHAFKDLRILDLIFRNCRFEKTIPSSAFRNATIFSVTFESCQLAKLPTRSLRNLHMLEALSVPQNRISKIPHKAFRFVSNSLRYLDLSSNNFTHVPARALRLLPQLQVLVLTGNRLTAIPADAFENNSRLEALQLTANRISRIEEAAFAPFAETLAFLGLSDNPLNGFQPALSTLLLMSVELSNVAIDLASLSASNLSLVCLVLQSSLTKDFTLFWTGSFRNVVELDLSNNQLLFSPHFLPNTSTDVQISGTSVATNDEFPKLRSVRRLDLSFSQIGLENFHRFPNVEEVYANHLSHLSQLSADLFAHTPFIKTLQFSGCGLIKLAKTTFKFLPRLTNLDLSHNRLRHLNIRLFKHSSQLERVNLSYNRFRVIAKSKMVDPQDCSRPSEAQSLRLRLNRPYFVRSAKSLEDLSLAFNSLVTLPVKCTESLVSLKNLDLSGNFIGRICNELAPNIRLETLLLQSNRIVHIDANAFRRLAMLTELDLSNNRLIDVAHLILPSSLLTLNLNQNQISTLNLNIVTTTDSPLKSGPVKSSEKKRTFLRLPKSLRHISLAYNELTSLDSRWFQSCRESLLSLDVTGNPINCRDCATILFVQWTRQEGIHLIGDCFEEEFARTPIALFPRLYAFNSSSCPARLLKQYRRRLASKAHNLFEFG